MGWEREEYTFLPKDSHVDSGCVLGCVVGLLEMKHLGTVHAPLDKPLIPRGTRRSLAAGAGGLAVVLSVCVCNHSAGACGLLWTHLLRL